VCPNRITSTQLNFILNQKSQQNLTILYIKTSCSHVCLLLFILSFPKRWHKTNSFNVSFDNILWQPLCVCTVAHAHRWHKTWKSFLNNTVLCLFKIKFNLNCFSNLNHQTYNSVFVTSHLHPQLTSSQGSSPAAGPSHPEPTIPELLKLRHWRVRLRTPVPHVTEHPDQSVQQLHSPENY
jgi:hypothetical protein